MKIINSCFPFRIPGTHEPLLFCFHHAGGNAGQLRSWSGVQNEIAVVPVEYAGHGCRMRERFNQTIQEIAQEIAQAISRECQFRKVYIYGHSLGSLIAFEAVKCLERSGISVGGLAVAGRGAPFEQDLSRFRSWMGRDALLTEMRRLGGMDPQLLENKEFMDYFAPIILMDYALHEAYCYDNSPIRAPIIAHCAEMDVDTSPQQMKEWKRVTKGLFNFRMFQGGHFFVLESETYLSALLQDIKKIDARGRKLYVS